MPRQLRRFGHAIAGRPEFAGNMAILGFDPARYHTGRAPIEAAAMGVELGPGDVAYRSSVFHLDPGQTQTVTFTVSPDLISLWNREMKRVVEPGAFEVQVGASSADIRLQGGFQIIP